MTRTLLNSLVFGLGVVVALCGHAAAQDYAKYRVIDTKVIQDMWAGPGQSAALLSPDGSRLLHLSGRNPDMCLFAPAQIGPWVKLACADYTDDNRPGEAQDMFWSPAGDQLLMPTYHDAFQRFRDTDIRIFDPATFTVRNLTDDGFDGSLLEGGGPAELDVLAHWGDENSIFFIRHSVPKGGFKEGVLTSVMTMKTDGSAPQPVLKIASTSNIPIWNFAVSPEARLLAYSVEDRKDADNVGIYLLTLGDAKATRIAKMSDIDMRLAGMAFSADQKYLLLLGRNKDGNNVSAVLEIATGQIIPVDANQNVTGVAWSPTGSALAYVTYDRTKPDMPGGLFLAPAPGKPARLLIGGAFYPTMCCGDQPIIWATNDTMVLSQLDDKLGTVLFVRLGQ